jgi:hypothetical protein
MINSKDTRQSDVEQAAIAVLANSPVRELRRLRVDSSASQLWLSGEVSCFYHKQLAQEAVRTVAGGRQVVNRVRVGV